MLKNMFFMLLHLAKKSNKSVQSTLVSVIAVNEGVLMLARVPEVATRDQKAEKNK